MATATIDTTEDRLVSAPETTVLFMARRRELRLTWETRYPIRDPRSGLPAGNTKGRYVAFRDGAFRCPRSGTVVLRDTLDGGQSEVDAAELIEWLEKHPLNGNRHEGFWEVVEPAPAVSREELQALMDAATTFDEERLEAILEQERAGWGREDLIETAERALGRLREIREEAATAERGRLEAEQADRASQAEALADAEREVQAARDEAKAAKAAAAKARRAKPETADTDTEGSPEE